MNIENVISMKVEGSSKSHARTDILTRDVESVIDEPTIRGGTNLGLTPTETLMASLIGCTNVWLMIIRDFLVFIIISSKLEGLYFSLRITISLINLSFLIPSLLKSFFFSNFVLLLSLFCSINFAKADCLSIFIKISIILSGLWIIQLVQELAPEISIVLNNSKN